MVHIIITTYNPDSSLLSAIASALSQSYTDIRLTLIDDHSKINVKNYLESFMKDRRFRYLRLSRNCGPSDARNLGLLLGAKTDYVTFHDDDDVALPNKISHQLEQLSQDRQLDDIRQATISRGLPLAYDLAVNKVIRKEKDGTVAVCGEMSYLLRDIFPNAYSHFGETGRKYSLHFPSSLFRISIFQRIGGFFPSLYGYEDNELAVRTILGGFGVNFDEAPLYYFNRNEESITYNGSAERREKVSRLFGHIQKMTADAGLDKETFIDRYRQPIAVFPGIDEAHNISLKDIDRRVLADPGLFTELQDSLQS